MSKKKTKPKAKKSAAKPAPVAPTGSLTLRHDLVHRNGTTRIKFKAFRGDEAVPVDADLLTAECARDRLAFARRLAVKDRGAAGNGKPDPRLVDYYDAEILKAAQAQPQPSASASESSPAPGGHSGFAPDDLPDGSGEPNAKDSGALLAEMPQWARQEAMDRLRDPELVRHRLPEDFAAIGWVGDVTNAVGLYVASISRFFQKPLNVRVRGSSSSGKSYVIKKVAELTPPEQKLEAHQITPKALYHLPDDALIHKVVFAGERSRVQDDVQADATKPLREMAEDGVLRWMGVITVDGKPETVLLEKQGPISYVESTTLSNVFGEDENRSLDLYMDESEEQTGRIVRAIAARAESGGAGEVDRVVLVHHAMQRMLRPYQVLIPYARAFVERFPLHRVEARRAWPQMLETIRAVALLRQCQKQVQNDTILADAEDYAVAKDIMAATIDRLRGAADKSVKSAWEAIRRHRDPEVKQGNDPEAEFLRNDVSTWAGINASAAGWRIKALIENGLLVETQEHKGNRPGKYKVRTPFGDIEDVGGDAGFPSGDEVRAWCRGAAPPEPTVRQAESPGKTGGLSARPTAGRR